MPSRTELGTALRSWRERVNPFDIGIRTIGERRVPGLRREELAGVVGISVDYLVQLEQGRASHPSPQVLAALARSLRLNASEVDVLYRLSGFIAPPAGSVPTVVPPGVQRMIDRMGDTRIAVFSASWDAVQCTPLWDELFGIGPGVSDANRNMIWDHFAATEPQGTSRIERDREQLDGFEQRMVADLRRAVDKYPDDHAVQELVQRLRANSARFTALWTKFETLPLGRSRKTVVHAELGSITLDCDILTIEGPDLHIVLNWARPETPDAEKLDTLRYRVAALSS